MGEKPVRPVAKPPGRVFQAERSAKALTRPLAFLLLLFTLTGVSPASDSVRTEQVRVSLLPERGAAIPGQTLWLGLRFELIPHWHVYWRNPGDSGEAPRVNWQLPNGWQAGDIRWPTPQRIPVGPLVNYGYEDSVTLLVPIAVPPEQPTGAPVDITADVSWLVCREQCIPQSGVLRISLPAMQPGDRPDSRNSFENVRAKWPVAASGKAHYLREDDTLTLRLEQTGWADTQITGLWFAAHDWGTVAPSQAQTWHFEGDALVLKVPTGEVPLADGAKLVGLLVVGESAFGPASTRGFEIAAIPGNAGTASAQEPQITLLLALGFAVLGGLLLNLMPCVLPVLSIKILSLVQHSGDHSARHGLVFGGGVLLSLLGLAALLIALRAGGESLGWGFQL